MRPFIFSLVLACGAASAQPDSQGDVAQVLQGRASYYSDALAGRSTASGEPYDPQQLTAASRDLPFGTRVRVTRIDADGNDMASVVVRVNDRGPYARGRVLDLSQAAAEQIGMIRTGSAPVSIELLQG